MPCAAARAVVVVHGGDGDDLVVGGRHDACWRGGRCCSRCVAGRHDDGDPGRDRGADGLVHGIGVGRAPQSSSKGMRCASRLMLMTSMVWSAGQVSETRLDGPVEAAQHGRLVAAEAIEDAHGPEARARGHADDTLSLSRAAAMPATCVP